MSRSTTDLLTPIRDGLVRSSRATRRGLTRCAHAVGDLARRAFRR
jgi:hypothetical protein